MFPVSRSLVAELSQVPRTWYGWIMLLPGHESVGLVRDEMWTYRSDGSLPVIDAAMSGFNELVVLAALVVTESSRLNLCDHRGSLLNVAILSGICPSVLRLLVIGGAMCSTIDVSGNNPFHTAVLCGRVDALLAMSRPVEVYETFRPFCVVPVIPLPHPFFNNLNSSGQSVVHLVTELKSYYSISSVLRALIVSVGAYIDSPRGGDLATLAHLAARNNDETLLSLCVSYGASINVVDLFGESVQSLINKSSHPYCACRRLVMTNKPSNKPADGDKSTDLLMYADVSTSSLPVDDRLFTPLSPYLADFTTEDLEALVNDPSL